MQDLPDPNLVGAATPLAHNPRRALSQAGLRAKKTWGQNFLCDIGILSDIAAALAPGSRPVVELGAGTGALTAVLLGHCQKLMAIERDRDLVPLLRAHVGHDPKVSIVEADAGRLDYAALCDALGGPLCVAGNLPYQLSSRILVNLADARSSVAQAVLLVQREVAERLVSPPGRDFGLLSVLVQRTFDATIVRAVPPGAFHPPPKVHSAVIKLTRKAHLLDPQSDARMVRAARAAFSARRKTLANALSGGLDFSKAALEPVFAACAGAHGLDPSCRAETLGLPAYAALGAALHAHGLLP